MQQALTAPISRTRIKICGLTRECDVDAAVAAGVDALGFVLYPKSSRAVSLERAAQLAQRLPPFITPVLLFVNPSADEVRAALHAIPHALLQFHGDETPDSCAALTANGRHRFIRAARIPLGDDAKAFDLVKYAHHYSQAQAILLDAHVTATVVQAKHSIGHSFQQASTLTSFCLVDLRLQT